MMQANRIYGEFTPPGAKCKYQANHENFAEHYIQRRDIAVVEPHQFDSGTRHLNQ
jgi:hypothetical protein